MCVFLYTGSYLQIDILQIIVMLGIVNYEHPHPLDTVFSPKSLSVDSDEGIQDEPIV